MSWEWDPGRKSVKQEKMGYVCKIELHHPWERAKANGGSSA